MKRKYILLLLALSLIISLSACAKSDRVCDHQWERGENLNEYTALDRCTLCLSTRIYTDSEACPHSGAEKSVRLGRFAWDGYGVGYKEIDSCDLGYAIMACLEGLEETEDIAPEISEGAIEDFGWDLPVERGTVWIECGSIGLFRLDPEMTEICKVERHLGEGKVMKMTDTLHELLRQAWGYYPYDSWRGSYQNGKVTLKQEYKADSCVEWVEIDDMKIENVPHSDQNTVTLRILANESKSAEIVLDSYQSEDNRGSYEIKEIRLVKGKDTTVSFTFYGFPYPYYVSITVDNTRIELAVDPKGAD